jgi:thioredoxin 1
MAETIHVNDNTFESTVLESALPVVVDFWAPWCGPCRMVAPSLDKIAKEYAGRLVVAKVNTDENNVWASRYGVRGIPTMLFVANGKVVHQQVGAMPYEQLKRTVDKVLAPAPAPATAVAAQDTSQEAPAGAGRPASLSALLDWIRGARA